MNFDLIIYLALKGMVCIKKINWKQPKPGQFLYLASVISRPSFKLLALILFKMFMLSSLFKRPWKSWYTVENLLNHPHIISNQLTKFQVPTLNAFRSILLTNYSGRFFFQRAITHETLTELCKSESIHLLINFDKLAKFKVPGKNIFKYI